MRKQGIKIFDHISETRHAQWLIVAAKECPDETMEQHFVRRHFLVPHSAWTTPRAFVDPVVIRRSRRRVLFYQEAGISLS